MADQFDALSAEHIEFIRRQHLFFVGTAGSEGLVNVSPKGLDSFRVVDANTVRWLNLTGSGNESAAHVLENGRMTIMFCSFDKQPLIMRLYGQAHAIHPRDARWDECIADFTPDPGMRQVFEVAVDLVQTSCGFAVPQYELVSERDTLTRYFERLEPELVEGYWREKNSRSLDDYPTGIFADEGESSA